MYQCFYIVRCTVVYKVALNYSIIHIKRLMYIFYIRSWSGIVEIKSYHAKMHAMRIYPKPCGSLRILLLDSIELLMTTAKIILLKSIFKLYIILINITMPTRSEEHTSELQSPDHL